MKLPKRELTAAEITKTALLLLKGKGYEAWRQTISTLRRNNVKSGVPDVIGYHRTTGVFLGCEVKTINDRFSEDQIEFLNKLHASGGAAMYATQVNGDVVLFDFTSFQNKIKPKNHGNINSPTSKRTGQRNSSPVRHSRRSPSR